MKIRLFSDIHTETGKYTFTRSDEDVVVLAGDIGNGVSGVEWAKTNIPADLPVIMVLGNHDYWNAGDFEENLAAMRKAAKGSHVHLLERDAVQIAFGDKSVVFLGCTLWTGLGLNAARRVTAQAQYNGINDYFRIESSSWNERNAEKIAAFEEQHDLHPVQKPDKPAMLHPAMILEIHQESVAWLDQQLELHEDDQVVVVTHHAPSMQCLIRSKKIEHRVLDPREKGSWRLTNEDAAYISSYATDLDELIQKHSGNIACWTHGHIHIPVDFAMSGVRIVSNPIGYRFDYSYGEDIKIVDLEEGLAPCLVPQARKRAAEMQPILEELRALGGNPGLLKPSLRTLMVRGLQNAADEVNELHAAIDRDKEAARHRFSSSYNSIYPQKIFVRAYGLFDQANGYLLPEILEQLIAEIEKMSAYFAGDGYSGYVNNLWNMYNKRWMRKQLEQ